MTTVSIWEIQFVLEKVTQVNSHRMRHDGFFTQADQRGWLSDNTAIISERLVFLSISDVQVRDDYWNFYCHSLWVDNIKNDSVVGSYKYKT